jgi:hypothetical protein
MINSEKINHIRRLFNPNSDYLDATRLLHNSGIALKYSNRRKDLTQLLTGGSIPIYENTNQHP